MKMTQKLVFKLVFRMKKQFVKELIRELSEETMCSLQYGGCPCNKCFHTWAEDELGLNKHMSHLFWMVVCALRGDYNQEEILKANIKNFEEIMDEFKE